MAGRQKGNYFKPLGSSFAEGGRSYKGRENSFGRDNGFGSGGDRDKVGGERVSSFLTCYNCGEKGHRSSECKKGLVGVVLFRGRLRAIIVGRWGIKALSVR